MDFTSAFGNGNNGRAKPPSGIDGFDSAEPAPDYSPLPPGDYVGRVLRGEVTTTRKGEEAYRIRFEITEGPQKGRTVVRTWTFGEKALTYTKRDLAPFGLTTRAKLLSPFPELGCDYVVRLLIALQRGDDGVGRNDVKRIELLRRVESPIAGYGLPDSDQGEVAF